MVRSNAKTPEQYLADLPEDRRETVRVVRDLVLENLPAGYEESMTWGMLSYEIPLSTYPETYNGKPLGYVALASQKNYVALYLMGAYAIPGLAARLEKAFRDAGKQFDMGKSCLRFRTIDDLEMDALAELIAAVPVSKYVEFYEASRGKTGGRRSARKGGTKAGTKRASKKSPGKK